MSVEPISLTREQLYQRVWSEPMSSLGPKLGLSDVGLAKVCRRMKIPRPGLGYWAKKSAGQRVSRTPLQKLPASADESLNTVTFKARSVLHGELEPVELGPVADQRRFEADEANQILVAGHLEDPHPLVAQSVLALRKAKPDENRFLQPKGICLDVQVSLDSSDRAMCIFDALLKALEARNYPTTIHKSGERTVTSVRILEEDIEIKLTEHLDRVERPAGSKKLYSWLPDFELVPSGKLTLRIDSWSHGTRQSWSDGKQQRVENCLNQFVVGLVVVAESRHAWHLEQIERERQYREEEERRLLQQRRKEEEAVRVRALLHVVERWRTARDVRSYLSEVRESVSSSSEVPTEISEWLLWADEFANRVDPLLPAPQVPVDPKPPEPTYNRW